MIRVLIYFVVVAAVAFGAAWLADRPGDVTITWLGHRIDTSVMVLASAVGALAFLSAAIWSLLRTLVRSRHTVGRYLRTRRGVRGYHAVSRAGCRGIRRYCGSAQVHRRSEPHGAARAAHPAVARAGGATRR